MNMPSRQSLGPDFKLPEDGYIHISPYGEYAFTKPAAKEGDQPLKFRLIIDEKSVDAQIAAFNADKAAAGDAWAGMLCDFDHKSLDSSKDTTAAGWVIDLQKREDGLWAKVRLTEAGQKAVSGGNYRYTSPVHMPEDLDGPITSGAELHPLRIYSLALTNMPRMLQGDFPMQPISSRAVTDERLETTTTTKGTNMDKYKAMLLKMLGLGEDATDEQIEGACTSTAETMAAVESAKKVTEGLQCRVGELEKIVAERKADDSLAALEKDGYKLTSRDEIRTRLVADHDNTLKTIRAFAPAPAVATAPGNEALRSRGEAPVSAKSATASDRENERTKFVDEIKGRFNLKSRATAIAKAQELKPELWK